MKYMVNSKSSIDNIGNAIREKLNTSTTYTIDQMPDAIRNIETGSSGGNGQTYTINNVNNSYTGRDQYGIFNQDLFNEIVEYYAAGYHVVINFSDSEADYYTERNPWYVAHIYDNIYGVGNYDRVSGAAICLVSSTDYETSSSSGNSETNGGISVEVFRGSSNYTIDENYFY